MYMNIEIIQSLYGTAKIKWFAYFNTQKEDRHRMSILFPLKFLINPSQNISLTDQRKPFHVLPHHEPFHEQYHG